MSPRPQPTRHDATAEQFLRAAAQLIDAYLDDQARQRHPARLRAIHFPAALEWLRTEDVIRLAAESGTVGVSRKAFFNRWPTRGAFLPDAVIFALAQEAVPEDAKEQSLEVPDAATAAAFSQGIIRIVEGVLESLQRHPRSYLTLNIGPLLPQHPELWAVLLPAMRYGTQVWADGYAALLAGMGLVLRPEWTPQRAALVLQAMLDGFLLRHRIQPDDYPTAQWEGVGVFADAVIAFILGAVDWERTGDPGRRALDALTDGSGAMNQPN